MQAWMVAMAGVVTVALAACTSAEGGQPTAAPGVGGSESTSPSETGGGESSKPGEGQTYGAPRVADPLDVSRFLPRPCDVLTVAQLETFGITKPGEPDTDSELARQVGPACGWTADSEVNSTVGVAFITGNKHGLSDTYRGRSRFDYFEETTVDGYPAVFNGTPDFRTRGDCGITVGIMDTLTFFVSELGGRKGQGSCDRAKQVAAAVIATLKGNA